jgi:HSP20 family protein
MTTIKSNKAENILPSLLSDFFDNDKFFNNRWIEKELNRSLPAVNIKESNNDFNIEFAAPGFDKTDFKISVKENILTVTAAKQDEKKEEKERFTRKEFSYNSFSRSFTLPETVIANKINAKYTDGILKLHIPKKEEARALPETKIKVA